MKTKKTAGRIALDILSIFFVVVFLAPVIWALFVSLQHEGKQISSIVSWFTPPYTISNYSDIIKNSSVPLWFMNSLFIAVIVTVATLQDRSWYNWNIFSFHPGSYNHIPRQLSYLPMYHSQQQSYYLQKQY